MTTLDAVSAKKMPEPSAEETAAKELVRVGAPPGVLGRLERNPVRGSVMTGSGQADGFT